MKISTLALLLLPSVALAGKKNRNPEPYPYGNPVITHMYTADAAPKVMPDGRLWMVTSVDHEDGGGYSTMHSIHAFSTGDMKTWVDHGTILDLSDLDEKEGEDWAIWAPDIVYRQGTYHLYFPMRNLLPNGEADRYIAVAESDRMDRKFTVTNPRMKTVPVAGLDPAVFIDDNGSAYLYWNQSLMGALRDDMRELEGKPFKLDYGAKNFMEAAWMHKREGVYYFNYHTKYDGKIDRDNPDDPQRAKSHLDYSMGDSPRGPLRHMGPINFELGVGVTNGPKHPGHDYVPWRLTQSNHGAVVEYHGKEYFFYHTSALSSWRQDEFKGPGTWTQRSVCVDELNYKPDGTVIPVKQTLEGVEKIEIDQPFDIELRKEPAQVEAGQVASFHKVPMGSG
ncbi:MAG: family 43 glycosylhydrolase, partial [Verrucomicrobiae bacterium]|nr:family 43 glycosylhydrolase [Verrucomicrobiae bacterium]